MQDPSGQRQIRLDKLARIRKLGIEPYPYAFDGTHTDPDLHEQGDALLESGESIRFSGRLMVVRGQGKAVF